MTLTNILKYDVQTKNSWEEEIEIEFPNPRISEIGQRLQEIKIELQQTDYQAIKFAEGIKTEEEYSDTRNLREALRTEYNILEIELTNLT